MRVTRVLTRDYRHAVTSRRPQWRGLERRDAKTRSYGTHSRVGEMRRAVYCHFIRTSPRSRARARAAPHYNHCRQSAHPPLRLPLSLSRSTPRLAQRSAPQVVIPLF